MDGFCVTFIFKDQHRITIWMDKTGLVKHKRKKLINITFKLLINIKKNCYLFITHNSVQMSQTKALEFHIILHTTILLVNERYSPLSAIARITKINSGLIVVYTFLV